MNRRPTTQDISWFLDQNRNNQLELNPPYQRRSVWTRKDRQYFLDTIFRGYPCPAIFLHKVMDERGQHRYNVVDGKQRLQTILRFVNDEITIAKDFGDNRLDGKKWSQLDGELELKRRFWDYVLPVEFIDPGDGASVNAAFDRLNRNSRKLERQELRHAQFDGWFIKLAEAESDKDEWKRLGVVTTARAKRMNDVQFLSELLLVLIERTMHGFDQDSLDEKTAQYDEASTLGDFRTEESLVSELENAKRFLLDMEAANSCITKVAGTLGNFYTLWSFIVIRAPAAAEAGAIATRYLGFMERVKELAGAEDHLEAFLASGAAGSYSRELSYFNNSRGANTDLTQRQGRFDALALALNVSR